MQHPATPRVTRLRAGACVIDLGRGLLLDARGEPLPLRPRAWQVLSHLAERVGQLVEKEELMATVWRDRAVTDDSLVQAVADIRRALGAGAKQHLRTLPGRGYMLMADDASAAPSLPGVPGSPAIQTVDADRAPGLGGSLGDRLRREAADRFVGREAELAALGPSVGREVPGQALYFVHGPGGIGKSSLLERLRLLADPGVTVVSVNGAELLPTPQGVIDGMGVALGLDERSGSMERLMAAWSTRGRSVLLLDTFESLDPVQGWIRDTFLPGLPAQVSAVLAGRRAPDSHWSAHPLWGSAMHPVALGMLGDRACARLAEALGVPADLCAQLARRSGGLPLAAVLLAGEAKRTGRLPQDLGEELVRALTRRCLEQAPSAAHREALLACALARRSTRALLAHLFGETAADGLFDWLAAQGYVTASRDGLRLHDLMREAVLTDAGGCDRDRFRTLRRTVVRFLATRLSPGRDAWDATLDFFYARRHSPGFQEFQDVEGLTRVSTSIATGGDLPAIAEFARARLPGGEFDIFLGWARHPAADVVTVRDEDGTVHGVSLMLRMHTLTDDDIARDPVIGRTRAALGPRWHEPTVDTYSLFTRHWFTDGDESAPNAALTALMAYANPLFADRSLRLFVLWAAIPTYLAPMWPQLGFSSLPECAREIDGVRFKLILRDWQAEPWSAWVRRVVTPDRPSPLGGRSLPADAT